MPKKQKRPQAPKGRNMVAVAAFQHSGAGIHGVKGYSRKVKHRNREDY